MAANFYFICSRPFSNFFFFYIYLCKRWLFYFYQRELKENKREREPFLGRRAICPDFFLRFFPFLFKLFKSKSIYLFILYLFLAKRKNKKLFDYWPVLKKAAFFIHFYSEDARCGKACHSHPKKNFLRWKLFLSYYCFFF